MISAIIVAGGSGRRMGLPISKQYIKLQGREVLARSIEAFERIEEIDEIIIVVPEDQIEFCREKIVNQYGFCKIKSIVAGGKERQQSVFNGLKSCSLDTDIVIIHDGARPFVTDDIIRSSIEGAFKFGACAAAVPVKDTIKIVDEQNFVLDTPERKWMHAVQTPQSFKYNVIMEAHESAAVKETAATDDTMLVEQLGYKVKLIDGNYFNIKITTSEDLIFAEAILNSMKS